MSSCSVSKLSIRCYASEIGPNRQVNECIHIARVRGNVKDNKWIHIIQVVAQCTVTCNGYITHSTCPGKNSKAISYLQLEHNHVPVLMLPSKQVSNSTHTKWYYSLHWSQLNHFVSTIREVTHTINLKAGCEWFAWVITAVCWRERSHSSILKALKVVRSQLWVVIVSLCRILFFTESEHRLVRRVHNWMSQTAAGHQEIEGEFFPACQGSNNLFSWKWQVPCSSTVINIL